MYHSLGISIYLSIYLYVCMYVCKFNTSKMFDPPKCSEYVNVLWIGPTGQVFADKISLSILRCFFFFYSFKVGAIFTTRSAFLSYRYVNKV